MTKTYTTYKDSGVQWIGQVPEHWKAYPLSKYLNMQKGHKPVAFVEEGDEPYVTMDYIRQRDNAVLYPSSTEGLVHIEDNDLLLLWDGANAGEVVRGRKGYLASTMAVLDFSKEIMHSAYSFFFLKSLESIFKEFANGTTIPHFDNSVLMDYTYPLPPLSEQQAIAEYLDKKTAKIDESVAALEAQKGDLQKYRAAVISEAVTRGLDTAAKMKDSGVDWIGEIPEGWKMSRLKHVLTVNGRVGFKGYTTADLVAEGEGAYTIGGKHITNCVLDLSNADYISWSKYYESPEIMVHQGDIVMAQRGTLGKAALIREDIGPATINPSLVLLNQIKLNNLYLLYYLLSNPTQECIKLMNTATAVPMISQNQIENMPIPVPPLSEQLAIAEYLDKKKAKIDESIALIDAQIADLQAYRSTVISEAVTGKVKVS